MWYSQALFIRLGANRMDGNAKVEIKGRVGMEEEKMLFLGMEETDPEGVIGSSGTTPSP